MDAVMSSSRFVCEPERGFGGALSEWAAPAAARGQGACAALSGLRAGAVG